MRNLINKITVEILFCLTSTLENCLISTYVLWFSTRVQMEKKMYINLKGIIQLTEIWSDLRIPCASSSALTLITVFKCSYINHWPIHCWCLCFDFVAKNKHDLNQWAWQGSTVGPSLYYPCLVKIQVQYNTPPPMLHDGMYIYVLIFHMPAQNLH